MILYACCYNTNLEELVHLCSLVLSGWSSGWCTALSHYRTLVRHYVNIVILRSGMLSCINAPTAGQKCCTHDLNRGKVIKCSFSIVFLWNIYEPRHDKTCLNDIDDVIEKIHFEVTSFIFIVQICTYTIYICAFDILINCAI